MYLPALTVLVALGSSCGFVHSEGESSGVARLPRQVIHGTSSTVTSTSVPNIAAPSDPLGNGGETKPTVAEQPQAPQLTPAAIKAIERCQLIHAFRSAGNDLYIRAAGRDMIQYHWIQQIVNALHNLRQIVSPVGESVLNSLLQIIEQRLPAATGESTEVRVSRLQILIDEIAPTVTLLMDDLQGLCPTEISIDGADDAEHLDLSKPSKS